MDIMKMYRNPDAGAWAKEFCKIYPEMDEGLMISWFANAMMAMHDYLTLGNAPLNGDHAQYLLARAALKETEQ